MSDPQVRAARIAATAAIIAALVSLGSGVLTFVSSQLAIVAEDKRSESEFMREQRQTAYAELLSAEQALRQLSHEFSNIVSSAKATPAVRDMPVKDWLAQSPDGQAKVSAISEAYAKYTPAAAKVSLMGPLGVSDVSDDMDRNYAMMRFDLTHLPEHSEPVHQALNDYTQRLQDIEFMHVEFLQQARSVLKAYE
jgi:hypothetical protein